MKEHSEQVGQAGQAGQAGHTPGPWYEAKAGNPYQGLIVDEATGATIAVTYDKAHAPIIAAAPDYDMAARQAVEWLPLLKQDYPDMSLLIKALEALAQAIAKAEGR